jgi:hypothetical protein
MRDFILMSCLCRLPALFGGWHWELTLASKVKEITYHGQNNQHGYRSRARRFRCGPQRVVCRSKA